MHWAAVTTLGSAFLAGMLLAVPGGLLPPLAQQLKFTEGAARRLRALFFLMFIPTLLLAGLVIDQWGSGEVLYEALALGSLLAVAGFGILCSRTTYGMTLAAALILAVAAACCLPAATLLMPHTLLGGSCSVQALNLGYVFVALGGLATTGFFETVQAPARFRRGLVMLAVLSLVCAGLVIVPAHEDLPGPPALDADRLLTNPRLLFAGLIVLLYLPLEASLSRWGARYLEEIGHPPRRVVWLIALFWVAFLAARLAAAWFLLPAYAPFVLFLLVLLIAMVLGNLAGAGPSLGTAGLLILWTAGGPVFPTVLGLVLPHVPGQAVSLALLYGLGSIGRLVFQPALSALSRAHHPRATATLPIALGLVLMAATLVLVLM